MWDSVIDATGTTDADGNVIEPGDPVWGELAFRGFKIEQMVMEFRYPVEKLSPFDYELMVTVHQERQRREGQLAYQRQEESRSQANKAHA